MSRREIKKSMKQIDKEVREGKRLPNGCRGDELITFIIKKNYKGIK